MTLGRAVWQRYKSGQADKMPGNCDSIARKLPAIRCPWHERLSGATSLSMHTSEDYDSMIASRIRDATQVLAFDTRAHLVWLLYNLVHADNCDSIIKLRVVLM